MSVEKLEQTHKGMSENQTPCHILTTSMKQDLMSIIEGHTEIFSIISEKEKLFPEIQFNSTTISRFLKNYPNITPQEFNNIFFSHPYNKIVLMCDSEVLDFINFKEVQPGDDLIYKIIQAVKISEEQFNSELDTIGKVFPFPNLSSTDVAQGYFLKKLQELIPTAKIISGDQREIKNYPSHTYLPCDSVGFIDPFGKNVLNMCLLKLLKTQPDGEKIEIINKLLEHIDMKVIVGGSTYHLPFNTPNGFKAINFPKVQGKGDIKITPSGSVINSMGYLNSAYYASKATASFVLGSHNIAEPMHAGKLTLISNEPKNRYNHNWLISYFGETNNLMLYLEGKNSEENQALVETFLNIDKKEIIERNQRFEKLYSSEIVPLVRGILINYLKKISSSQKST